MNKHFLTLLFVSIMLASCSTQKKMPQSAYAPAGGTKQVATPTSAAIQAPLTTTLPTVPTSGSVSSRQEKVRVATGEVNQALNTYNIIVGSFTVYDNAVNLKKRLISEGYNPTLLQNEQNMYRVCILSSNEEATARSQAQTIKNRFADFSDAWLLIAK